MPDALAMAVALEPEIVRQVETRYVEVELAGRMTRGQLVVDWYDLMEQTPNAHLVLDVDRDRYWELLQLSLR